MVSECCRDSVGSTSVDLPPRLMDAGAMIIEPEVWWSPDGIDAHGIGDGVPYEYYEEDGEA